MRVAPAPIYGAGDGRRDFCCIFRFLQRAGVLKIFQIVVDDAQEPSHSDEAIIECLKPFSVEEWDWKKVDLCPNVIYEAAPGVREITLYSRGNNAALRGWSQTNDLDVDRFGEVRPVPLCSEEVSTPLRSLL